MTTSFDMGVADGVKIASVSQFLAGNFGPQKAREDMNLILAKAKQGHPRAVDVLRELRSLELASHDSRVQKDIIEIVKTEADILRGKRLQILSKISPETAQKLTRARNASRAGKVALVAAGLLAAAGLGYGGYRAMTPKRYGHE